MKIAIIGQPNVGKSSLFNRLVGARRALETPIPGTTRDRLSGTVVWNGLEFTLIDTPGLLTKKEQQALVRRPGIPGTNEQEILARLNLEQNIELQVQRAMAEAGLILFVIDGQTGPQAADREIAKKLRSLTNKHVLLLVNKVDRPTDQASAWQYYKLGLGTPFTVSAKNGLGTAALLDHILEISRSIEPPVALTDQPDEPAELPKHIRLAIIGRPNVGKSSLFNALLGEKRVVVSPLPHTTRNTNDTEITYGDYRFTLIDTAGLRKKARIYKEKKNTIEIFSIKQTLAALKRSDIALLMFDLGDDLRQQDMGIGQLVADQALGLIIIANKWDTVPGKATNTLTNYRKAVRANFCMLDWAPVIFSDVQHEARGQIFGLEEKFMRSATPDQKVKVTESRPLYQLLDLAISVWHNRTQQLGDSQLTHFLKQTIKKLPPPRSKATGRRARLTRFQQISTNPPTFEFTLPTRVKLPPHYFGYLENQMREHFNFWGTSIVIQCQNKAKS